jgi:hypothetical protein
MHRDFQNDRVITSPNVLLKNSNELGIVVHTYNPSIQEAKMGGS